MDKEKYNDDDNDRKQHDDTIKKYKIRCKTKNDDNNEEKEHDE
jgi:hypothetical protein